MCESGDLLSLLACLHELRILCTTHIFFPSQLQQKTQKVLTISRAWHKLLHERSGPQSSPLSQRLGLNKGTKARHRCVSYGVICNIRNYLMHCLWTWLAHSTQGDAGVETHLLTCEVHCVRRNPEIDQVLQTPRHGLSG